MRRFGETERFKCERVTAALRQADNMNIVESGIFPERSELWRVSATYTSLEPRGSGPRAEAVVSFPELVLRSMPEGRDAPAIQHTAPSMRFGADGWFA